MKIYRVVKTRRPGWEHDGFDFFSNKKDAQKAHNENYRSYREQWGDDDDYDEPAAYDKDEITIIEFEPTKQGIIEMLNQYADIPDNG